MTRKLYGELKLFKQKINICISGLGQVCINVFYRVNATIRSKLNNT